MFTSSDHKLRYFISSVTFLFVCTVLFLSTQTFAQRHLTVINPSFERPDSGKITGFDGKSLRPGVKLLDIPGWRVDAADSLQWDSGIEAATDFSGKYRAFLMGGDPGIYQNLVRRVFADDMLKLTVDAKISWLGTKFKMELFYLDGDSATAPRVTMISDTITLTSAVAPYSISVNGSDVPLAVGHRFGILLDNVSPDSASWLQFDNVQLMNEDPTIIEVPNFSFELPDSSKIKGWNGPGSGIQIATSQADIPGWTTDTIKVTDSGLEARGTSTEGIYDGFLMGSDTAVWNTTDYTILAGDEFTLRVTERNSWQATTFHLELYYVDEFDQRVFLNFDDIVVDVTDQAWHEHSIQAFAADDPACVGRKLGVLLDNVSPTGASWTNHDNVRINVNHPVVGVNDLSFKPTVFSLDQNYPNPFNPATKISYSLAEPGKVLLSVYDILGREVAVLVNNEQAAGTHEVSFNAGNLSSGIYFYTLQSANRILTCLLYTSPSPRD